MKAFVNKAISNNGQKLLKLKFSSVLTLIFLIATGASKSFAQGYIEGVNASYEYMPLTIKSNHGDQKFKANIFRLSATLPIFLTKDKSQLLLVGGNFEAFDFGGTHPGFEVQNLYSISPTFGYSRMLSPKLNLTALLTPFINTDLKTVRSSDIHFGGIVRGTYQYRSNLSLRGTVGFRQQYYGPQYIVLVGFDWQANKKWRIYGDAPSHFTVNYNVNKKVNAGFNLTANNTSYRLDNQNRYMKYNYVHPGLYAEYYVSPMWALRGTVAYSITRNMEIFNEHDKVDGVVDFVTLGSKPVALNPEISNGAAVKISLSYRIPQRKR